MYRVVQTGMRIEREATGEVIYTPPQAIQSVSVPADFDDLIDDLEAGRPSAEAIAAFEASWLGMD